jgi:inner membrane protein
MDNLTHSLVAVALSRAGLNRLAPSAGWLAVAAANLADADIVSWTGGTACYLQYHRGWTHALAWGPLLALAPLPFWWLFRGRPRTPVAAWVGAYLVALAGVFSHHALDWLNVYGIRLLLPFSGRWLHADLVHIVDVWVWTILGLAVIAPALARLVEGEIGARRKGPSRAAAWAGLLALGVYLGGRAELHAQALEALGARLYEGEAPRLAAALPNAWNPWRWTGVVRTASAWRVVPVDLIGREFNPDAGTTLREPEDSGERRAVAATRTGRAFLDFSQMPYWTVVPADKPEGARRVSVYDLRFGLPGEGAFEARFLVDAGGRVLEERFLFGNMERSRK